jgi:hypothetical protein
MTIGKPEKQHINDARSSASLIFNFGVILHQIRVVFYKVMGLITCH